MIFTLLLTCARLPESDLLLQLLRRLPYPFANRRGPRFIFVAVLESVATFLRYAQFLYVNLLNMNSCFFPLSFPIRQFLYHTPSFFTCGLKGLGGTALICHINLETSNCRRTKLIFSVKNYSKRSVLIANFALVTKTAGGMQRDDRYMERTP